MTVTLVVAFTLPVLLTSPLRISNLCIVFFHFLREKEHVCAGEQERGKEKGRGSVRILNRLHAQQEANMGLISWTLRIWLEPKSRDGCSTNWATQVPSSESSIFEALLWFQSLIYLLPKVQLLVKSLVSSWSLQEHIKTSKNMASEVNCF